MCTVQTAPLLEKLKSQTTCNLRNQHKFHNVFKQLLGRVCWTEPQTSFQLTSSSCLLSVEEWLATLYKSTKSPSMPSPSTGRCVAIAARAWHMWTRDGSQARWSWPSRNSTTDWLRCGRPFSSLTREVSAVWWDKRTQSLTARPERPGFLLWPTFRVAWALLLLSWLQSIRRDCTPRMVSCSSCAMSDGRKSTEWVNTKIQDWELGTHHNWPLSGQETVMLTRTMTP